MKRLCNRMGGVIGLALLPAVWSAGAVDIATTPALTNAAAGKDSFLGGVSGDGKVVVFLSVANNLVTNDDSGPHLDLFARNLPSANTTLLSVSATGVGGGNGNSSAPSISSNGQWVVFQSAASNLIGQDTNGVDDIYLRDLSSKVTTLVSVNAESTDPGNGPSRWPKISANGQFVVFESLASDLVTNDFNGTNDVFVRDLQTGITRLVSVGSGGAAANGSSTSAAITPDGGFIAFLSAATDIVPGAATGSREVFVRDTVSGAMVWASTNVGSFLAKPYICFDPAISADGAVVAFKASTVSGLALRPSLFRVEVNTGVTTSLTTGAHRGTVPQISVDGRFVAFEADTIIFRSDAISHQNTQVDPGLGPISQTPIMTPDGTHVAFLSGAPGAFQMYLRDMAAQTPQLISVRKNGVDGSIDLETALPSISDDGRFVAFDTADAQMVDSDLNFASDVFLRDVAAAQTILISERDQERKPGTGVATTFLSANCFSSNGQRLAFATLDNNFADRDTNGLNDIFVRDFLLNTNISASVQLSFLTNGGGGAVITNGPFRTNVLAREATISADGHFVAFTWEQAIRQLGNASPQRDVYLHDLESGLTSLLSRNYTGTPATLNSGNPSINADGSITAFQSTSPYLIDYLFVSLGRSAIFARRGGSNYLVSINRTLSNNGNGNSVAPMISPDSRWVLFYSGADDLTSETVPLGSIRLFAHDLDAAKTRLLSLDQAGLLLSNNSAGAVISANSRYVAFYTTSSQTIYRFDLQSAGQTNLVVCTNCSNPSISGDGRFVAYESRDLVSGIYDVYVKDIEASSTSLVSLNRTFLGGGNGHSRGPQISPDARYVVFTSQASNLVENDTNNVSDIFVRDLVTGTTLLLSINGQGTSSGNGLSSRPVMALDGRTVAFQSFASDLVPGDYNRTRDIFVVHLAGQDSDHDGMDDDWEMAFFNTLSRDGSGDYDGDGQTDRQEFLAGTDPTNAGSVFRVLTVSAVSGGNVTLLWSAVPGRSYTVQFKDNVEVPGWTNLVQNVRTVGSTGSTVDHSGGTGRRFYRVLLQK